MNLQSRITKLEQAQPPAALGNRIFRTMDGRTYWESHSDGYDYREACLGLDGTPPNDGRQLWTQAELDALDRAGWQVIIVQYVNKWRELSPDSATG